MLRYNPEGIPRHHLRFALTQPEIVRRAREAQRCLLCCRPEPNAAGLCEVCTILLDGEERQLCERWLAGMGP